MTTQDGQGTLFPDLSADRRLAVEADVDAAGGQQVVGHDLGLHDDPKEAGKLLNNKLNENGRHRLSDFDVWRIRQLARQRSGRSRIHEFECQTLNYEGKWLTTEDIKAKRRARRSALLAQLVELDKEDE